MAKPKSCGFLIYRENPESGKSGNGETRRSFLLMRHPKRWDLPKGHVDEGETNLQCALRELEEETGIREEDIEIDPHFKFKLRYKVKYKRLESRSVKKKLIIYLARLTNEVHIKLTEHEGYEWVEWAPPHKIQRKTIDPLLEFLAEYWGEDLVRLSESA